MTDESAPQGPQAGMIIRDTLYSKPVVAVHLPGSVLVMSEQAYTRCLMRGKLLLREQNNEARDARKRARAEAAALDFLDK